MFKERQFSMKHRTLNGLCIYTALLTTTMLVGTLMASTIGKGKSRSLDPMIIEIVDRAETGTMNRFNTMKDVGKKNRVLNRKHKPAIGVQRENTRLQVKFVDELKVRIDTDGKLYSKSNRNIDEIASIADRYSLTLRRSINRSESDIDALVARAEIRARKASPDLNAIYWIDGASSLLSQAAAELHRMDEVEYVFWNTIFDPTFHTSDTPSIFSELSQQRADEMIENNITANAPRGACYIDARMCEENHTEPACEALGGYFLGENSVCTNDETNSEEHLGGAAGACCYVMLTGGPTSVDGTPNCLDSLNDGMTKAVCQVINAALPLTNNAYAAGVHANGVWYGDGSECTDIATDCLAAAFGIPAGAFGCGETGTYDTVFSGDCYHDQTDPAMAWGNRVQGTGLGTVAPGCWDAAGFPAAAPTNFEVQNCCDAISIAEIDPTCSTTAWDDMCANFANSSEFTSAGLCVNPTNLIGLSGDCASPWGTNFRPIPVNASGTRGTQRMVVVSALGVITDRTVGLGTPYGCGWSVAAPGPDPIVPGQPVFAPVAVTPDYSAMGLLQHTTDEAITGTETDVALFPWPMGGAQVGDATNNTILTPPVTSLRGDARWIGTGLNLFADGVNPVGIGNGNMYSGLYGLGLRRQDETGFANGTHGLNVQVAVLDYSAYLQTYTDTAGNTVGANHEDFGANIMLEGPNTTGHDALQMIFNPPDAADYPFDFPQSANHGTAQIGVISASWNQVPSPAGILPTTNIGAMGIAPNATVGFFPLVDLESLDDGTGGRAETAWFNAMEWLRFGDVISAGYIGLDAGSDFANHAFNPSIHSLIQTATNLGIQTVIGAGDAGVDLEGTAFPNDIDPGAISMCATTPGGTPAKRWADSVGASNFVAAAIDVSKNTAAAWGFGVTTTGMGPGQDNWLGYKTCVYNNNLNPQEVQGRSYTNNFNGTAAAASIGAGAVACMQGYSRQVFQNPLAPEFIRQFAAHGQMLGVDPDTGEPIFQNINAAATGNNVVQGTDNDMLTTPWPGGTGTLGFDIDGPHAAGSGNIVGYFMDPRYACIRMTVDPIFETQNMDRAMFIRGDMFEGVAGSTNPIATLDGIFFAAVSEATPIGFYENENSDTVPGPGVQYNFDGETTDFYFSGEVLDPRGNPALDLNNITVEVDLAPTQAPTTMLQLWMWDWDLGKWVQPSVTGALVAESTEHDFQLVRPGSLLNANGRYHARIVSITGNGPTSRFPIYYDQIRLVPTIPTTQP